MKPELSIISVNYLQPEATADMLKSIKEHGSGLSYEVILIDLCKNLSDEARYASIVPQLTYIQEESNPGFAASCNIGASYAKGSYLYFLNNDTIITSGSIHKLLNAIKIETVGGVSPTIRYYNRPEKIQYAGITAMNFSTGSTANLILDEDQNASALPTHYLHGAAMMIKSEVYSACNGMSEKYFLYFEELDLSEQIKRKGYQLHYIPEALIYHKASLSTGKNNITKTYYMHRNRILFVRSFSTMNQYLIFLPYITLITGIKAIKFIFSNSYANSIALCRGFFHGITFKKSIV